VTLTAWKLKQTEMRLFTCSLVLVYIGSTLAVKPQVSESANAPSDPPSPTKHGSVSATSMEQQQTADDNVGSVLRAFEKTILDSESNATSHQPDLDQLHDASTPGDISTPSDNGTHGLGSDEAEASGSTNNSTGGGESAARPRLHCVLATATDDEKNVEGGGVAVNGPRVQVVNGTELQLRLSEEFSPNVTNRTFPGLCSITLFYGSWCNFSAKAAPFYNALPRYYPGINMYAIEATNNINILAQYGVIALPSILVFHNSRPMFMFNTTEHSLESYVQFLTPLTGISPRKTKLDVSEDDLLGPVPTTVVVQFNYNLLVASLFLVTCAIVNLSKSTYIGSVLDNLRNAWREVEIQHEHTD